MPDLQHDKVTHRLYREYIPIDLALAIYAGLFTCCALSPLMTTALFGYRAGERAAISIGALSGLALLTSCGLLVWFSHVSKLSGEDKRFALAGIVIMGMPALCVFLGSLVGYIAMGFLGSGRENK